MESRGAFTSIGVTGAFRTLLPNSDEHGPASVYAEFAHARGWLQADRVLTAEEHASIRQELSTWVGQDRLLSEALETFGPPSVLFGGSNPFFGKTLGYLTDQVDEPMIFFHLWNGTDPDAESTWPPIYSEPILLAVRCGRGPFTDTFAFTPEGKKRRPATECPTAGPQPLCPQRWLRSVKPGRPSHVEYATVDSRGHQWTPGPCGRR
ncbi:hypothetical protein [Nocardia brevicatena]|uniref:hypothetical protein n=1 Tax=Nocardia brevicatena TaxID=37327 RepID=UPI00030D09AB|nr:hypothetical protein [Nocardia brevicatena]